ncbi:toxin-antitoxin system protein [Acetomicrobium flavidum]
MLQSLSAQTGRKMQEILGEAVELYRRKLLLDKANAAFAALKADSQAWKEEQEERAAWDVTLLDGLKDN